MICSGLINSIRKNWFSWLLGFILITGSIIVVLRVDKTSQETSILIPVAIENIPDGLALTDPDLKSIELIIRGSERKLRAATTSKLKYQLDLSKASEGFNSYPIMTEKIGVPKGITVVKVNPTLLTFNIDKKIEKKVAISVTLSGKPASRFYITETKIIPKHVSLRGPDSVLSPLKIIKTKPVDISGVKEFFKKEIALDLIKGLSIVSPNESMFVEFTVKEKMMTKTLTNLPIVAQGTRYKYTINPKQINIQIEGTSTVLESIEKENGVKIYLNLNGLKPGKHVRRAEIILPVKTTLIGVNPEFFTVVISNR